MSNTVQKDWKLTYFQHNVTRGRTITILRSKFGNDGYAFWFGLLELLGASEGAYLDLEEVGGLEYLSSWCGVTDEQALEMITLLCNLKAIDKELYENHNKIWSQKFVDRMNHLHKRRQYTPTRPNGVVPPTKKTGVSKGVSKVEKDYKPNLKEIEEKHPTFDVNRSWERFVEYNKEKGRSLTKSNWEWWWQDDNNNKKYRKKKDPNRMMTLECPACDYKVGVKFSDRNAGYFCQDEKCEMQLAYGMTLQNERAFYKKQAK